MSDDAVPHLFDVRVTQGEVTYDPFPPDVCNADFRLETDPIVQALKPGETFAIGFGEIYTPAKFYVTHYKRAGLLVDLMADLK